MTIGGNTNSRIDKSLMATDCRMDFSSPTFRRKQEKRQLVEMSIVKSTKKLLPSPRVIGQACLNMRIPFTLKGLRMA